MVLSQLGSLGLVQHDVLPQLLHEGLVDHARTDVEVLQQFLETFYRFFFQDFEGLRAAEFPGEVAALDAHQSLLDRLAALPQLRGKRQSDFVIHQAQVVQLLEDVFVQQALHAVDGLLLVAALLLSVEHDETHLPQDLNEGLELDVALLGVVCHDDVDGSFGYTLVLLDIRILQQFV